LAYKALVLLAYKEPPLRQELGLFYFVPPIGGDMGNQNLKVGGFSPPLTFEFVLPHWVSLPNAT
jgi:hypothetical protein